MADKSTSAIVTSVAAATSATTLATADTARDGVSVSYSGAAILYLIAGEQTPTSALYTAQMGDGYLTYWEAPAGFTGKVSGLWSAATGSALVTVYG